MLDDHPSVALWSEGADKQRHGLISTTQYREMDRIGTPKTSLRIRKEHDLSL